MHRQWIIRKRVIDFTGAVMVSVFGSPAASLTLVPVGSFGEPLNRCDVVSFQPSNTSASGQVGLVGKFEGLRIPAIPLGQYEAIIRCEEGELRRQITLDQSDQIALVVRTGRIFVSDHIKPKLLIGLRPELLKGDIWWIRLVGLYNTEDYLAQFLPETNEATIIDPDPGSYLVIVQSKNGLFCSSEVDLVEGTKLWTFNRSNCSFQVDRFAHLVTDDDKRNFKIGPWYQQVKKDKDSLLQQLLDASGKQ